MFFCGPLAMCNEVLHMSFDNGNFEEYLLQEIADLKDLIADQEERIRSFDQRLGIHWKIIEKQVDWSIWTLIQMISKC